MKMLFAVAGLALTSSAFAQTPQRTLRATSPSTPGASAAAPTFIVKTIPLHHLTSLEAVKLLSPYSTTPGGGVYDAPDAHAVTIRETAAVWQQMTPILERYDRAPELVALGFTLIRADNSGRTDPSLGGLDSTLRSVLRFTGYHGLVGGGIQSRDGATAELTFLVDKKPIRVTCTVERVNSDANPATAQLRVTLSRSDSSAVARPTAPLDINILSTGLTIPADNIVVVGSGAYGESALVLAVRWKKGRLGQKE